VSYLDKKIISILLISVIAIAGIGILYLTGNFPGVSRTVFHYERNVSDELSIKFQVSKIADCEVDISFTDSETLLFSIDLELYEPGVDGEDFLFYYRPTSTPPSLNINYLKPDGTIWQGNPIRIKSMHVTFGSSIAVGMEFWECNNLTTSIEYNNGAILGRSLEYYANGTLSLIIDDSVDISAIPDGIHIIEIGNYHALPDMYPSSMYVDIDLPSGLHGYANFNDAPTSITTLTGWVHRGGSYYSTDVDLIPPRLSIDANVGVVSGSLVN